MTSAHVTLAADSIPLPEAFRRHVRWEPGDALVIESDGDSLLVRSLAAVVREVQESFAPYRIPGVSVVDELIADRRAEAAREEAEWGAVATSSLRG